MQKEIKQLSIGQGQEQQAELFFKRYSEDGTWILLHNTHLFPIWLNGLEKKIDNLKQPDIHPEFRMFMTTASNLNFPCSVIKDAVKVTVESGVDAKTAMLNAYQNYSDEYV